MTQQLIFYIYYFYCMSPLSFLWHTYVVLYSSDSEMLFQIHSISKVICLTYWHARLVIFSQNVSCQIGYIFHRIGIQMCNIRLVIFKESFNNLSLSFSIFLSLSKSLTFEIYKGFWYQKSSLSAKKYTNKLCYRIIRKLLNQFVCVHVIEN